MKAAQGDRVLCQQHFKILRCVTKSIVESYMVDGREFTYDHCFHIHAGLRIASLRLFAIRGGALKKRT